jgi:hypothetical protein
VRQRMIASIPNPLSSRLNHWPLYDEIPGHRPGQSLPASHPILAQIAITPVDWCHLEQLDADNPATVIVGHDTSQDGQMTVFIACASKDVRDRLEDGWG